MPFKTGKTYTHAQGLSCCFRQWGANHSHCQYLHGYAIQVELEWNILFLDEKNWGVDFGDLKPVKQFLEDTFDHKLLVAENDPHLETIRTLHSIGLAQVKVLPNVGCEAFAKWVYDAVNLWTIEKYGTRCRLTSVVIREHGGNHAKFYVE